MTARIAAAACATAALGLATSAAAVAPCAGRYVASADSQPDNQPLPDTGEAKLELRIDGRFKYEAHHDGVDQTGEGTWRAGDDRVILHGDPVTAPAFTLEAQDVPAEPGLRIELDLPNGLSRQYFFAAIRLADGTIVARGFTGAPFEMEVDPHNPPVAVRVNLPVYKLSSAEQALDPGTGHRVRVRFAANDLGRMAFADEALIERDGALILTGGDGDLAFRRQGRCTPQ